MWLALRIATYQLSSTVLLSHVGQSVGPHCPAVGVPSYYGQDLYRLDQGFSVISRFATKYWFEIETIRLDRFVPATDALDTDGTAEPGLHWFLSTEKRKTFASIICQSLFLPHKLLALLQL